MEKNIEWFGFSVILSYWVFTFNCLCDVSPDIGKQQQECRCYQTSISNGNQSLREACQVSIAEFQSSETDMTEKFRHMIINKVPNKT